MSPTTSLFRTSDRSFVQAVSTLTYVNPFLRDRDEAERRALGDAYDDSQPPWVLTPSTRDADPNVAAITSRTEEVAARARERLAGGVTTSDADLGLYEDLALFDVYHRHRDDLIDAIEAGATTVPFAEDFRADAEAALRPGGRRLPSDHDVDHLLAYVFQVGRAFHHVSRSILGRSEAAMSLRAEIWQSIFTHDLRRYVRALSRRMANVATLVTGPSGTGKELVARAIGMSGYVPFDERTRSFAVSDRELFRALNLSALSSQVIEAELFGYRRGAFTGATEDRRGWFDAAGPLGTVFLDEIGDIDASIQVKLLRVLQTRTFNPIGDTRERRFDGKVICATNRDLDAEMRAGRFREDLYYRICSDRIVTPSLAAQLVDAPGELEHLVRFIAARLAGDDEADALTDETVTWIRAELPDDYAWPGNFRELEQCVRNVLVRGRYDPDRRAPGPRTAMARFLDSVEEGALTADELLSGYVTSVYASVGSFEGAARRLGLDRRTVKARIDDDLLARLRGDPPA